MKHTKELLEKLDRFVELVKYADHIPLNFNLHDIDGIEDKADRVVPLAEEIHEMLCDNIEAERQVRKHGTPD